MQQCHLWVRRVILSDASVHNFIVHGQNLSRYFLRKLLGAGLSSEWLNYGLGRWLNFGIRLRL
jgi:hypothetical protein